MRWDTKRYITELFIGFLVVGMVAGMLIFREYETVHPSMTPEKVVALVQELREGK